MPKRIQRKRTKGWRMPPNTVCVTRPSIFGNPFPTAAEFREALEVIIERKRAADPNSKIRGIDYGKMARIADRIEELRGKDLACYCKPEHSCHADVLIEFANKERA